MNKNKYKKNKSIMIKFFVPLMAVIIFGHSTANASNAPVGEEINNFSHGKSGLRNSEVLVLKMNQEMKMLEQILKSKIEIAKLMANHGSLKQEVFYTDINLYNESTNIKKV